MMSKKMTSLVCLILATVMILGLCACGGKEQEAIPTLAPKTTAQPEEGATTEAVTKPYVQEEYPTPTITVESLKYAKIVYPTDGVENRELLLNAIQSLQSNVKLRYKVEIDIETDASSESQYEILIGNTNRKESDEVYTNFKLRDYGYAICGSKIVIKAGNEESLVSAVKEFNQKIVGQKKGGKDIFYKQEFDNEVNQNYLAQYAVLNGVPISEYAVVYPKTSKKYEQEIAVRLKDYLELNTGSKIACYSDATPAGAREILVGVTNRAVTTVTTEGAAVESDGKSVVLVGQNAYDYGLAQDKLTSMLELVVLYDSAEHILNVPAVTVANRSNNVSMMSYNVYGFEFYTTRCDNICSLVTKYLPDIVGFQEPDMQMMSYLNKMSDYYGYFYGNGRHTDENGVEHDYSGANSVSPILYAKDRYTFLAGDTKWMTDTPDKLSKLENSDFHRIYTYALLRDRFTGQTFIVVNHHLDFKDDVQVKSMQYMFKFFHENYKGIPIVMLGDFNANASSTVIKDTVIAQGGFTSLYDLTPEKKRLDSPTSIDWIFAMDCCVSGVLYDVCNETYPDLENSKYNGTMPSDHPAVYAEMKFLNAQAHTHDWSEIASKVSWSVAPSAPQPQ